MNKLIKAIEIGNILDTKNYLKAYITGDPTDSDNSIKAALKQIETENLSVWDKHDGAVFNMNKDAWTQDYFVDLQVDLRMNFSKERFLHMLEVGKVAFPMSIEQPIQVAQPKVTVSKPSNQTISSQTTNSNGTSVKKNQPLLYGGIAAVAVVVLVVVLIKLMKNG